MNPHRSIDRWIREHPDAVDLWLALTLWFLFGLLPGIVAAFTPAFAVLAVSSIQLLALIWRRTRPGASAAVVVAGSLLQLAFVDTFLPSQVAVPITLYTLAAYGRRWQSLAGLALGITGALMATLRFGTVGGAFSVEGLVLSFLGISLIVLLSWTFGDLARNRRLALKAVTDRARRLEVERQQERELAAADERHRIAREMHDIVAHTLSIIITQADGARYAAADRPGLAVETLGTIADEGRKSLREMRRLLGVLRSDDEASSAPLPTLEDIPELVEATRTSGLDVVLGASGNRRRSLPPGAELAAYRAVQEGLTNVIRHAGPAVTATVRTDWGAGGLTVSVVDNGRGATASEETAGSRQGLVGMAERVRLYDGTVHAGPRPAGGFEASVFIPYSED
ncbi:sensor histidine kinase [Zafaria sp. J156]|uniref:sensor histidine kinase n=1 Tax=Zafaria sp. J156 TaxID=3116490 RepID=UPI002E79B56D|nr:sensor histidine kinase [Zafaria sp. J156]MEE1620772.1 sensor histidine kinase [Zafaria sp. J156]